VLVTICEYRRLLVMNSLDSVALPGTCAGAHDPSRTVNRPQLPSCGIAARRLRPAASIFQKTGLLSYVHGRIIILDRPGLEAASCGCYRIMQRQFEHLLG
jgi:hypothetical protein